MPRSGAVHHHGTVRPTTLGGSSRPRAHGGRCGTPPRATHAPLAPHRTAPLTSTSPSGVPPKSGPMPCAPRESRLSAVCTALGPRTHPTRLAGCDAMHRRAHVPCLDRSLTSVGWLEARGVGHTQGSEIAAQRKLHAPHLAPQGMHMGLRGLCAPQSALLSTPYNHHPRIVRTLEGVISGLSCPCRSWRRAFASSRVPSHGTTCAPGKSNRRASASARP
mmetsp:Transcript_43649/g.120733  ORF Transcript_43649/g.120733 Transcript_43649/m.120733 type:complete len:219 (+) Transcript_43649:86-742(+)